MTLEEVSAFLQANLIYYVVSGITLFLWDVIELYIELKQLTFLQNTVFGVYYWIRLFFSLALVESVFAVNLLNVENKALISFVTPLLFSTLLQNLVVNVGGGESNINFKEIFDRFKERIVASLQLPETRQKAHVMMQLYENAAVTTERIQNMCQFHGGSEEYANILAAITGLSDGEKRKALISALIKLGGVDAAKDLLALTPPRPAGTPLP